LRNQKIRVTRFIAIFTVLRRSGTEPSISHRYTCICKKIKVKRNHLRELDVYWRKIIIIIIIIMLYRPLLGLGRFFSFLILYTVGRIPWTGDQPVVRPLPIHRINAHNTAIHALSGIRTQDPSIRASEGQIMT
jgi:hypothetical protein